MLAHAALRRAVRPLRRAPLFDELTATPASRLRPPISVCRRCNVAVGLGAGSGPRLFSTAPPPPRYPPPPPSPHQTADDKKSTTGPEPMATENNPFQTSLPPTHQDVLARPPPRDPEPKPKPKPEVEPEPEPASSPASRPSSSSESPSPPPTEPSESEPSESTSPTPPPEDSSGSSSASGSDSDRSLPSFSETHRHPLSARFSTFMDNLQSRAVTATQKINDLTGYSAIEAIKARNTTLEEEHRAAQARLRAARHDYKALTAHRAATQREVTTLLTRKDMWNPADLERFTTLYRLDHELEAQVAAAAEELTDAEADEARLGAELNAGILRRYHEEQIWSDRIRRQSTWGTWGLMGVNVVLFLVLQFVAEPWKRKRLMRGIAESEKGVMEEVKRELEEVRAAIESSGLREREAATAAGIATDPAAAAPTADEEGIGFADAPTTGDLAGGALGAPALVPPALLEREPTPPRPWKEILMDFWEDPELLREAVLDLYSDRRIDLRMRDASLIALQGAAAGATVVAVVAVALLRSPGA